jgi:hypothetical protein
MRLAAAVALGLAFSSFRGPCDLKTVEKKVYCPKCVAYVDKKDTKSGECVKDKAKTETVEVCIKQVYVARCHPDKTGSKPVSCCGNTYDKPTEELSRVIYACSDCMEKGATSGAVKHTEACKNKIAKKSCEKSGTGQHMSAK